MPNNWVEFSLDADARPRHVTLAAAHRGCFGHVRCSPYDRLRGSSFSVRFPSGADASGACGFALWLCVSILGISTLHGSRLGTPGSSFYDLFYSCRCRDFLFSHGRSAVVFRVTSGSPLANWCVRACRRSDTTRFHFGSPTSR